jgi:hypothetical protein
MKTGRLLKIPRPDGEVHVYLYQDGPVTKAAVYVRGGVVTRAEPVHTFTGGSEMRVEQEARAWVEAYFPKGA